MEHIKIAAELGTLAARAKFAADNPGEAEKKDKASGGNFLSRHKGLLAGLGGAGILGGGLGYGLSHLMGGGGDAGGGDVGGGDVGGGGGGLGGAGVGGGGGGTLANLLNSAPSVPSGTGGSSPFMRHLIEMINDPRVRQQAGDLVGGAGASAATGAATNAAAGAMHR